MVSRRVGGTSKVRWSIKVPMLEGQFQQNPMNRQLPDGTDRGNSC